MEKEMNYEQYKEAFTDITKNITNFMVSEENFKTIQEFAKKKMELQDKIDELANEWKTNIDNDTTGYYLILEYCLEHIKQNDKNYLGELLGDEK